MKEKNVRSGGTYTCNKFFISLIIVTFFVVTCAGITYGVDELGQLVIGAEVSKISYVLFLAQFQTSKHSRMPM